jgi:fibronectin type 3 domain-containing protein
VSVGFANKTTVMCALIGLSIVQLFSVTRMSRGAEPLPQPPAAAKPGTPSGIKTTSGNGQISLVWTAVSGATNYHLKRSSTSGGPYTTIASPTWQGYTNVGLKNGTTYYFVVSAVNASGESANSAQVSAKPTASTNSTVPTGFTASPGNGLVGLGWSPVTGATSYHLKRATTSGGPYATIASPTWQGYTDVGRTNGVTYFYVVSAIVAAKESANSAQVSAKPAAPTSTGVTSVTVSPDTASSLTSGTLPFKATVQGTTTNKGVTWKAALGSITSSGSYTAPAKAGTDTVTATSIADPTKSGTASVKVTLPAKSVLISWSPSSSSVAGYNIYRGSVSGGPYTKLNPSVSAATTYTDTTVQSGHTYYYVTTAVDSDGVESKDSNQASVAVP